MKAACKGLAGFLLWGLVLAGIPAFAEIAYPPPVPGLSKSHNAVALLKQARRVLWIGAHPDDEASLPGILARVKDYGGTVYLVSVTRGENSYVLWSGLQRGSQIGSARERLFVQSGRVLHADEAEVGPFTNGPTVRTVLDGWLSTVPYVDWPAGTRADDVIERWRQEGDPLGYVVGVVRKFRPDVVVAMDGHCGVSGHPEHRAVGKLLTQAVPLASDRAAYPDRGEPWKVHGLLFNARVLPEVVACEYCQCEGDSLPEPMEELPTLEPSSYYGTTYWGVGCRVMRTYETVMLERGWTRDDIDEQCSLEEGVVQAEARAGRSRPDFADVVRVRPIQ